MKRKSNDYYWQNINTDEAQAFIKRAMLGTAVSGIVYPAIVFKNNIQSGVDFNLFNLRGYYKGITPFMASYVPTVAVAMTVNGLMVNEQSTPLQKLLVGFAGGIIAGPFCVMQENIAQNMSVGDNTTVTVRNVVSRAVHTGGYSSLFRGLLATSIREGGFACGYLALMPWCKAQVSHYAPETPTAVSLCSAAFVGTLVGTLTTPFDLWRNQKQQQLMTTKYPKSYAQIFTENRPTKVGWKVAFRGAAGRSLACTLAIFLMDEWNNRFISDNTLS